MLSQHSLLPILSFARSIMSDNRMRFFQIQLQRYWHIYVIKIEYLLKVKIIQHFKLYFRSFDNTVCTNLAT